MKILIIHHTLPDVPGFTTKMFEGVLPILEKYDKVDTTWVISSKSELVGKSTSHRNIINMFDYRNATDILKQEKPDLIYVLHGTSIPDYAFSLAAKYLKIPVIGGEMGMDFLFIKNAHGIYASSLGLLQESSLGKKMNQFFERHLFLIRTQIALRWNIFQIIKDVVFFMVEYWPVLYKHPRYKKKFELDRVFVRNKETSQELIGSGYNSSNLIITGDPTYDEYFQLLKIPKNNNKPKDKKNILIITTIIFGESRKNVLSQRKFFVEELVKAIPSNEFDVTIKIHPTHEDLKDYRDIIDPLNSTIEVTQNANLVELILNADIIIAPVTATSTICSLIARKPIIIWNVFNVENDALIQNKLALPCKNNKMILEQIRKAEKWMPKEEEIEKFVTENFHSSDGMASARIANEILNVLKSHDSHMFNK